VGLAVLAGGGAGDALHGVAGDQAVAVDAQEALGELVLELHQGFVEQVFALALRATTYFCSAFR
jgi:hypothetical protein